MRIDKYLKVARILKKRPVAKQLVENERLIINGRKAKASSNVEVNDEVTVVFGNKEITFKVLELRMQASKADASNMYEIISERKIENEE